MARSLDGQGHGAWMANSLGLGFSVASGLDCQRLGPKWSLAWGLDGKWPGARMDRGFGPGWPVAWGLPCQEHWAWIARGLGPGWTMPWTYMDSYLGLGWTMAWDPDGQWPGPRWIAA